MLGGGLMMERLYSKDLTNIVGGLENHVAGMPQEKAKEILSELSDGERKFIDEVKQPMTYREFKYFWEHSNNKPLRSE